MSSIKGPGIFLAQFLRDEAPYDNLVNISRWMAELGYKGGIEENAYRGYQK